MRSMDEKCDDDAMGRMKISFVIAFGEERKGATSFKRNACDKLRDLGTHNRRMF